MDMNAEIPDFSNFLTNTTIVRYIFTYERGADCCVETAGIDDRSLSRYNEVSALEACKSSSRDALL